MSFQPAVLSVEVRPCSSLSEFEECVRIEHATWGEDIAVPSAVFVVAHHTGGQVLGAFQGNEMIGFALAFAGIRHGEPFLHSHMTAVVPDFRDRAVGRKLKLFQREAALERGIGLIEWTFDPLETKNAYFNLRRLGAIARRLIPNCYGLTKSPLHSGLPTDRLVAEWWLDSDHVRSVLSGEELRPVGIARKIALPADIDSIKANDHEAASRIQSDLRQALENLFAQGYAATGFERRGDEAAYALEPANQIAGLTLAAEMHK